MDSNRFRSASNQRFTKTLFFETNFDDKPSVVYTLKDRDHEVDGVVYPSLYRLYMEMSDPLEYRFANTYLDGYEHWQMLCECSWFKPYVHRWRNELELKKRSEALVRLEADAISGSRSSAVSNRYLVDGKWREKNGKGRPSKSDVKKEAQRLAERKSEEDADMSRIFPSTLEQPRDRTN